MKTHPVRVPGDFAGHRVLRSVLSALVFSLLMAAFTTVAQSADDEHRAATYRVVGGTTATAVETESRLHVRWTERYIELQDPGSRVGYAYHRLRNGGLELFQLFHSYETAIRYELRDAWLFDENADFANELQFWDGSLLDSVERQADDADAADDIVDYAGIVDDAEIALQWLASERIPNRIQISTPTRVVRFERLSGPLSAEGHDWPEWEDRYEDIDFVDLGDRGEHPVATLIHAEQHPQGH
jgi:hypothetical protein